MPLGRFVVTTLTALVSESLGGAKPAALEALVGASTALLLMFIVGLCVSTFFGRLMGNAFERHVLLNIPLVKDIYPHLKNLSNSLLGSQQVTARHIVAIQYPCQGLYSIGFVMSEGISSLNETLKKSHLMVFVPTSPTPATGALILVPADQVIPLRLSFAEASMIIFSCGATVPAAQLPAIAAKGCIAPPPPVAPDGK